MLVDLVLLQGLSYSRSPKRLGGLEGLLRGYYPHFDTGNLVAMKALLGV